METLKSHNDKVRKEPLSKNTFKVVQRILAKRRAAEKIHDKEVDDIARKTGRTCEETIDELSNDTLASYKKKAGVEASTLDKKLVFTPAENKQYNKRFSGIIKATNKQFVNDKKLHEENVDENIEQSSVEGPIAKNTNNELGPKKKLMGTKAQTETIVKAIENKGK